MRMCETDTFAGRSGYFAGKDTPEGALVFVGGVAQENMIAE